MSWKPFALLGTIVAAILIATHHAPAACITLADGSQVCDTQGPVAGFFSGIQERRTARIEHRQYRRSSRQAARASYHSGYSGGSSGDVARYSAGSSGGYSTYAPTASTGSTGGYSAAAVISNERDITAEVAELREKAARVEELEARVKAMEAEIAAAKGEADKGAINWLQDQRDVLKELFEDEQPVEPNTDLVVPEKPLYGTLRDVPQRLSAATVGLLPTHPPGRYAVAMHPPKRVTAADVVAVL